MSYYFDDNGRYQIIFPYTSDKIHVAKDINYGAFKCYQELKECDIKTYIFMVYAIDGGTVYYFNIPKYKHLQDNNQNQTNPDICGILNLNKPEICKIEQNELLSKSKDLGNVSVNTTQICEYPHHPKMMHLPEEMKYNQITQSKQNEIITRLNHVEYQLETLKNNMLQKPKQEDDNCVIL